MKFLQLLIGTSITLSLLYVTTLTVSASEMEDNWKINRVFEVQAVASGSNQKAKHPVRVYHNETYQILDTAVFFIYYRYQYEQPVKGKELVKTDEYFFSINADSPIQPLTIDNLKKAFPENNRFHYALDEEFRSDKELIAYDDFLKTYKIKYLYNQSLK